MMHSARRFGVATALALSTMEAWCDHECKDPCDSYFRDVAVDRVNATTANATFIENDPGTQGHVVVRVQLLSALGVNNNPVDDELWVAVDGERRFTFSYPSTREGQTFELLAKDLRQGGRATVVTVGFQDFGGNEGHFHARLSGLLFGGTFDYTEGRTFGNLLPGKGTSVVTIKEGRSIVRYPSANGCVCMPE